MKHVLLCLCVALLAVSGGCWAAAADVEPSARRQPEAESWQPPPSLDVLPSSRELPELVRFANGRKVATRAQWGQRRKEMKAMVQYFEYGHLPPRPDVVRAAGVTSRALQDGTGVQQRITLVIGSAQRLKMRVAISRPTGEKRCPVMVAEVHSISPLPCIRMFLKHGYMFVQYQREDLAADRKERFALSGRPARPDHGRLASAAHVRSMALRRPAARGTERVPGAACRAINALNRVTRRYGSSHCC